MVFVLLGCFCALLGRSVLSTRTDKEVSCDHDDNDNYCDDQVSLAHGMTPSLRGSARISSIANVRRDIAARSCSALRAMLPTVRSFSSGMSQRSNLKPLSRKVYRRGF